jgi:hypothetical protein
MTRDLDWVKIRKQPTTKLRVLEMKRQELANIILYDNPRLKIHLELLELSVNSIFIQMKSKVM